MKKSKNSSKENKNKAPFYQTPRQAVSFIRDLIFDKAVIDVGCGNGVFAKEMAKYAEDVYGVEIDKKLAKEAEKNGLDVWIGDFKEVGYDPFNIVFAALNFEFIDELYNHLKKVKWRGTLISLYYPLKGVKPNRTIIASVPNLPESFAGAFFFKEFPFLIYKL